ncbi:putative bifunctional diguanylate cyclase/phosphodiesterase [Neorhizobium sp. NPDC001467]|uniref:putative bifunctional diguanylate cyclase/phosphodiesterase n=1 Tax=Neorhizobium sp. NPDC001467 TaxID=3390595 RepID=UPI003CFFF037
MTHSVESRFVAIISGALLAVVVPLFTLFLALSSQQAAKSLNEQIEILTAANAQALSKPLWELDLESVRRISGTLVAERNVRLVKITDTLGKLDVTESNPAHENGEVEQISRQIFFQSADGPRNVGRLTLQYVRIGWFAALNQMEMAFISIFIIAILTVVGAAILGNRIMIIKPLLRLTAAIEATRRLGSRHHVDWRSSDEMGRLAGSFNEMQIQLDREERELKRAHQLMKETYNLTPAMLFSLDAGDTISAVSDYWLLVTGYRREDVLGRPFRDLVAPADRDRYTRRKGRGLSAGSASDITVGFACADGRIMDALIAETRLVSAAADLPASLSVMTDVTELKQSELRNHQQAISDYLTGLLNRHGFETALDTCIAQADISGGEVACLFIDLDRFKAINDNLGHAAGDTVLRQFTQRLLPLLREHDAVSRLGGDEFAILVTGDAVQERALALCDEVVDLFDLPFPVEGQHVRLSASMGLAFYPLHADSAAELLQKSDMAMYERKRDGKNGAQVFDASILNRTRERAEIEQDIEAALAGQWFEAHFQPIVEIETGRIIGFEALMRMRHPRKGLLPPAAVIDVAEENGSIAAIGKQIFEDAIANLARVSRIPGLGDAYVAVNFSPLQFDRELAPSLASILERYAICPSRLVIEITEAVLMHDNPEIRGILDALHQLGCRIAIDDFGTGYSSLSYMSRFPVDIVKIDQSFIRSLDGAREEVAEKSRMLVEGISAISRKMKCAVIAEGVETEDQRSLLRQIGVDCAQGYFYARPLGIADLMTSLSPSHDMPRMMAG